MVVPLLMFLVKIFALNSCTHALCVSQFSLDAFNSFWSYQYFTIANLCVTLIIFGQLKVSSRAAVSQGMCGVLQQHGWSDTQVWIGIIPIRCLVWSQKENNGLHVLITESLATFIFLKSSFFKTGKILCTASFVYSKFCHLKPAIKSWSFLALTDFPCAAIFSHGC